MPPVKAISALWNLPLFRLDMNAVFGTDNPESTFLKALRSVEAVAPALEILVRRVVPCAAVDPPIGPAVPPVEQMEVVDSAE